MRGQTRPSVRCVDRNVLLSDAWTETSFCQMRGQKRPSVRCVDRNVLLSDAWTENVLRSGRPGVWGTEASLNQMRGQKRPESRSGICRLRWPRGGRFPPACVAALSLDAGWTLQAARISSASRVPYQPGCRRMRHDALPPPPSIGTHPHHCCCHRIAIPAISGHHCISESLPHTMICCLHSITIAACWGGLARRMARARAFPAAPPAVCVCGGGRSPQRCKAIAIIRVALLILGAIISVALPSLGKPGSAH
jgi:hypothetical protein